MQRPRNLIRARGQRRFSRPGGTSAALLAALLALCVGTAETAAEPLLLIVRADSPVVSLTRKEIADLYLDRGGMRDKWGEPVIPLDLKDDTLRERFYNEVAEMSLNRLRAYWSKRVFTGRGRPPAERPSDQIAASVMQDPHVVAYLPAGQCPKGVTVLHTTP